MDNDFKPEINTDTTPEYNVYQEQNAPTQEAIHGLSTEEEKDPNKIEVTIANTSIPVVVLYGPAQCGKTMTLIRLTRWLKQNGFRIEPERSFRPSHDKHYKQMCDEFNTIASQNEAAKSTGYISFMLVQVSDSTGTPICQILEAPGEYYFDKEKPNALYPTYVQNIIHGPNRKIWCMMVEPDWENQSDRINYSNKIQTLSTQMSSRDKAIFIYNKIDLSQFVINVGNINTKSAYKDVEFKYPGIFARFRRNNILFGRTDNFKFIPFQTGTYVVAQDGTKIFTPGNDNYPKLLWDAILKYTRG